MTTNNLGGILMKTEDMHYSGKIEIDNKLYKVTAVAPVFYSDLKDEVIE